jgi:hypothetical protein
VRIPFGTMSYQHASLPLSAQRMVNCYLEPAPAQAKTFAAVICAMGVANLATVGTGPLRGSLRARGKTYVVSGSSLYLVSDTGSSTNLGTVGGTSRVFMAGDETNVLVVDPGTTNGYYYNGAAVAQVADADWPGAIWCGYLDGYFIIIAPNSGQFYITANRNPASIDALDFASAERYPDNLVTGVVDKGEVILFGTESFEGFYDSGNSDFPITKIASADGEIGCPYPYAPKKADNGIFFPGHTGKVYRLAGYTPQVISTPVVEQAIAAATDRVFRGLTWGEPGHEFYALTCDDFSFVYDIANNLWHERESYGLDAWRWEFVIRAGEQWLIGDTESSAIGYLSASTATEFGATMRLECTSPPVGEDNKRTVHPRLELVFEQGVGLATGQGSDPMVMLQFSDDGGRTWSSEKWRPLGAMGLFKTRAIWNRLGQARDRIYRYAISDPVRRTLILATTEAEIGAY